MIKLYCLLFLFVSSLAVAQSPVPPGAKLEIVATGFQQPEGPVWKEGLGLLFSDIARSKIYQWSPSDSSTTIYLNQSNSSNGLTFDAQGLLILTQMQFRRVSRQELNSTITPLASTFRGKKFNSPNDLVVKSDGSIFFTDPDYNIPIGQSKELSFNGIYRINPSGNVQLLDSVFNKPNGICFSPNESKLYVNDVNIVNNSATGKIYVWDIVNDSTIINKKLLYQIPRSGYVDGMKTDIAGNIYCTGPTGVWVISPDGVCLDTIVTPRDPSNCAWGDADRKTLYITTGNGTAGTGFIYRIRLASSTSIENHGSVLPGTFQLYTNYPNPFNPSTTIYFQLPCESRVALNIYDIRGRKIETLIEGIMQSGYHHVQFNPKGIGSGIYLYRLIAEAGERGSYSETMKMIVLK